MNYLVGDLTLNTEERPRVLICFEGGKKIEAVYTETYGYNHIFLTDDGNRIRLSNHFMELKGIQIRLLPKN